MSLITDIVRCAVRFETAAEMQSFLNNWILKFGQAHQSALEVGWLSKIQNETRQFFRIFSEYFRDAEPIDDAGDAADNHASPSTPVSEDLKLFEICRIRNRLDPDLIDAPGGYRDLAFKLKIGFVRCGDALFIYRFCIVSFGPNGFLLQPAPHRAEFCTHFHRLPESCLVRILPVGIWAISALSPKFIVVELQLLIQIMQGNDQMHRNYATMRDKMTN